MERVSTPTAAVTFSSTASLDGAIEVGPIAARSDGLARGLVAGFCRALLRGANYFLDFCRLREALTALVMISPSVLPKA
jgi:hypothetical protein